jgi:hypothetical protein
MTERLWHSEKIEGKQDISSAYLYTVPLGADNEENIEKIKRRHVQGLCSLGMTSQKYAQLNTLVTLLT